MSAFSKDAIGGIGENGRDDIGVNHRLTPQLQPWFFFKFPAGCGGEHCCQRTSSLGNGHGFTTPAQLVEVSKALSLEFRDSNSHHDQSLVHPGKNVKWKRGCSEAWRCLIIQKCPQSHVFHADMAPALQNGGASRLKSKIQGPEWHEVKLGGTASSPSNRLEQKRTPGTASLPSIKAKTTRQALSSCHSGQASGKISLAIWLISESECGAHISGRKIS